VLEPDPYLDACILGRGQCNHESSCSLHDDWQKIKTELVQLMQTKSISEIAAISSDAAAPDIERLMEH
jgi:DNA-binding IscR family transcriptional regulator